MITARRKSVAGMRNGLFFSITLRVDSKLSIFFNSRFGVGTARDLRTILRRLHHHRSQTPEKQKLIIHQEARATTLERT